MEGATPQLMDLISKFCSRSAERPAQPESPSVAVAWGRAGQLQKIIEFGEYMCLALIHLQ